MAVGDNNKNEGERRMADEPGDKTRRLTDHGERIKSIDTHVVYIRKAIDKMNGNVQAHTVAIQNLRVDVTRIDGHCEMEGQRITALSSSLTRYKSSVANQDEKGKDRTVMYWAIAIAALQMAIGVALAVILKS